jgi:spermidine/putrescine-binding protein
MTSPREFHAAVRLNDGKVLVAGGEACCFPAVASAEIYDPATGLWTATGSMATTRCCGNDFLTLLADGRVMAADGYSGNANLITANGTDAEIFDPTLGTWAPTGNMLMGHSGGSFTLLTNGMVLAAGGYDGSTVHSSAELWNPATDTWTATTSMAAVRASHSATLLTNGKVLVAAGYDGASYLPSAELYAKGGR